MDVNSVQNMAPYIRGARDGSDDDGPPNIVQILKDRQLGGTRRKELMQFADLKATTSKLKETRCDLPACARSVLLMCFSHDCTRIASIHGNHNIYVFEIETGKLLNTLKGHPGIPWCIEFHPTCNDILASGCLSGEVRVWDLQGGRSDRWTAEKIITSLTLHHSTDQFLVIATGNSLYFWNWNNAAPDGHCSTNNDLERVRYVKFDPLGFRIITGISNMNNSGVPTGSSNLTPTASNDPLPHHYRIQVWDFTAGEFPPIYDATANIVVRRCMIENDASVDISQDGEKLVALIPSEERELANNLMFGVFSLHPGQLGRTLCIWGYISNAVSVSFSPLAQYVVVGSANSRFIYSNLEKAVAQIIKINENRDSYDASYIRSFTQIINNRIRLQPFSSNCVRWLPVSGLGIAYGTHRHLCICKPIAGEMFENVPNETSSESTRIGQILHQIRALYRHRPL